MLSFKPTFHSPLSLSLRLFSSSLSAMVLPAYLRLLIFLLAILIPACASSNLTSAGFKQKWEETEGGKEEGRRQGQSSSQAEKGLFPN